MNRDYKHYPGRKLPLKIDGIEKTEDGYEAVYAGWHFEGRTARSVVNKVLAFVFAGGEDK
jgi:hypothetical protein